MKKLLISFAISLTILNCVIANAQDSKVVPESTTTNFVSKLPRSASDEQQDQTKSQIRTLIPDGLYLIQREAVAPNSLEPLKDSEILLINDYEFLSPDERGKTSHIVVDKNAFIPLVLKDDPVKNMDAEGKPKLSIGLAEEQVGPLEKFTRDNVMKNVAIVIGGKVVTMHKIRVPIIGGKIQITRCTDHGCEALYTELIKRDSK